MPIESNHAIAMVTENWTISIKNQVSFFNQLWPKNSKTTALQYPLK